MTSSLVTEQLRQMPISPGVYLMKDTEGNILYIGKAASLYNRVRSYFSTRQKLTPKLQRLVARVSELDFFVTGSEQEALILELNLIKRHHPRYNVSLKDDKTFPYLRIDINEDWPRVYTTRYLDENGGRYFGPFASARSVRQTLKIIRDLFPFRSCTRAITGSGSQPCLEYHIHRCPGPCIGAVSREEYAGVIKQVVLFLEGKQERIVRQLESKMKRASQGLDFEKAALLRDQIDAITRVVEGQKIATTVSGEQDVIAFVQDKNQALAQVFFIRRSKLTGRESFVLQGTRDEEPTQIMTSFIEQFYDSSPHIPPQILLQYPAYDLSVIKSWLQDKRGGRVNIQVPRRGNKKQLVELVAENARQGLEHLKIKQLAAPASLSAALKEIQKEMSLPRLPSRIECYDISNIQGSDAVGSMAVFEQGRPKPAHYRRFRIKTVSGADDYAMLREVLSRRFKHTDRAADTWAIQPDLVLIDGGKGQLNAAHAIMGEAGAESIPLASLAKENEEIFIPQRAAPIRLPHSSPGLQLLQRLRDEAHRFAISYHRNLHKKRAFTSALDAVAGIGPKRKRNLLRKFGSVRGIREASEQELTAVTGMTRSTAKKLKEYL
ncbi:excinuclease ABC subunit UvrC [Chloroflexota bacterium]